MVRKEKVPDNIITEVLEDRKIQTIFWFIVTFAFKHKPYKYGSWLDTEQNTF